MNLPNQPPITQAPQPYKFKTVADTSLDEIFLRILLVSRPKAGKTVFLGTAPKPAIADYDGDGWKVLKGPYFREKYPDKAKDIIYDSFEDLVDKYGLPIERTPNTEYAFFKGIAWLNEVIAKSAAQTLCVDTLTTMSTAARNASLPISKKRKRSNTWENAREDHMILMAIQDFGGEMSGVEQFLDQITSIKKKHIIVAAHERVETTDSGTVTSVGPLLTGDRLRGQIGRWFDEVWYLDVRPDGKRVMLCQPQGVYKGIGSRMGLPAQVEDPSFDKLLNLIKGLK